MDIAINEGQRSSRSRVWPVPACLLRSFRLGKVSVCRTTETLYRAEGKKQRRYVQRMERRIGQDGERTAKQSGCGCVGISDRAD